MKKGVSVFKSSRYRRLRTAQDEEVVERRPPRVAAASYLLLGLLLGLAAGLTYSWLLSPIVYVDASPARLNERYEDEYIFLVSQNYAAHGDWQAVERRLALLEEPKVAQRVAALFERYLREGEPASHVGNLAALTKELGGESPALSLFGPTPMPPPVTREPTPSGSTPTATLLPTPTLTPRPSATPRPTATASPTARPTATTQPTYRLLEQEQLCDPTGPAPRIEVEIVDALLEPLPGVEVLVTWDGGADRFFTGFQPDRGPGFGDFAMSPDVSYSVMIAGGSPTISGLRIEPCEQASEDYPGGWSLTFQNLEVNRPTATPEE